MTQRSGQYARVDRLEVQRLREELDAALPPLRAKALTAPPIQPKNSEHAEFLAAFGALTRQGWTLRAMSRHLGISHRYLIDMRRAARPARTEACDWVARMWGMLAGSDVQLPSGTGW
jgi:hypothetical protein